MAELLGTVAAAVQLASCCKFLAKALRSIKYTSYATRRYRQQLRELETICQSIQSNSMLQTTEISVQIQVITNSIHEYIEKLGKSRLLYWLKYLVLRGEIADFFKSIEEKKSSLVLSVISVSALAIHEIRCDIQHLRGMSPKRSLELEDTPNPTSSSKEHPKNQHEKTLPEKAMFNGQEHAGHGRMIVGAEIHGGMDGLAEVMANHEYRNNKKVAKKEENKGKPGNSMVNGVVFGAGARPQRYTGLWENNVMEDDGDMVCGTVVEGGK